jgi:hypothetical protein
LTAPGMLVTQSMVLLTLLLTPWLTTHVQIEPVVRALAAALLLAHIASTLRVVRQPGRRSTAIFLTLLGIDGLLCGILTGPDPGWRGAVVPIVGVALALGFETAGWVGLGYCAGAVILGVTVAVWSDVGTPLVFLPGQAFLPTLDVETRLGGLTTVAAAAPLCATALSVEPSFAGVLAVDSQACAPASILSVETLFAGRPAVASTASLFIPTLLLVCCAVAIGGGMSLLRVRHAKNAVPTQSVATS